MQHKPDDSYTRELMLRELDRDIAHDNVYLSHRLTDNGRKMWVDAFSEAIVTGKALLLVSKLNNSGWIKDTEKRTRNSTTTTRSMPKNAAETLAYGEWSRYEMRAMCLQALESAFDTVAVEVCRVKQVESPRSESEARIGDRVDPAGLLHYLRQMPGEENPDRPDYSWLRRPNTGLGIRLVETSWMDPILKAIKDAEPDRLIGEPSQRTAPAVPPAAAAARGDISGAQTALLDRITEVKALPVPVGEPTVRVIDESSGDGTTVLRIVSQVPVRVMFGGEPIVLGEGDAPTVWLPRS